MEAVKSDERFFEGLLTVQMKDKQGEVTIVDELYKVLPVWMDRGAPISDTHSNRIIGKGINYSKTTIKNSSGDELPAIKITGKIFKDYQLDNLIWDKIKNKEYKGLSFGGATKSARTPFRMKDGSMAYALSDLEHYEVAVCKDPAVPMALITDFNPIAKAHHNGEEIGDGKMKMQCTSMGCYVDKADLNESQTFEEKVQALMREGKSRESAEKIVGSFVKKDDIDKGAAGKGELYIPKRGHKVEELDLEEDDKKADGDGGMDAGTVNTTDNFNAVHQNKDKEKKKKKTKKDKDDEQDKDWSNADGDNSKVYNQNQANGGYYATKGDDDESVSPAKDMEFEGKADTTLNQTGGVRNDVANMNRQNGMEEEESSTIARVRTTQPENKFVNASYDKTVNTKVLDIIKANLEKHEKILKLKSLNQLLKRKVPPPVAGQGFSRRAEFGRMVNELRMRNLETSEHFKKRGGVIPKPTGGIRHRDGTIENVYDDPEAHKRGMDEHNKKVAKDPSYRSYNPQTDKA